MVMGIGIDLDLVPSTQYPGARRKPACIRLRQRLPKTASDFALRATTDKTAERGHMKWKVESGRWKVEGGKLL
jgi:hypothetical protein